jgi:serine/threonine protein kinase
MPFKLFFKLAGSKNRPNTNTLPRKDDIPSPIAGGDGPRNLSSKGKVSNHQKNAQTKLPGAYSMSDDSLDFDNSKYLNYLDNYRENDTNESRSYSDSYDDRSSRNSVSDYSRLESPLNSHNSWENSKNGGAKTSGGRSDLQSTDSASFHSTDEKLPPIRTKGYSTSSDSDETSRENSRPYSRSGGTPASSMALNPPSKSHSNENSDRSSKTISKSNSSLKPKSTPEYNRARSDYYDEHSSGRSSRNGKSKEDPSLYGKSSNSKPGDTYNSTNNGTKGHKPMSSVSSSRNVTTSYLNGATSTPKSGRIHSRTSMHQRNTSTSSATTSKKKETPGLKRFLKKFKVKEKALILPSSKSSELFKKYGALGKLLGTGASGSVNLVTSKEDGHVFAVKKFRPKLPNESEQDYRTKVRNEFKIGEYLSHENLIYTKELIKDYVGRSKLNTSEAEYYIVMEYCPYDFFNLVMSGLMEQNEIACYFKQIINGVAFLHQHGLAHRDLKLDNCVVNDWGQLKLIDFGSAVPFAKGTALHDAQSFRSFDSRDSIEYARGVVGSDPYLAPEVFDAVDYDPRLADVWSIAIIYCCMILKRFPWKIPKASDPSYRSFLENDGTRSAISNLSLSTYNTDDSRTRARGADRLLRMLPGPSRRLIKAMLIINPNRRYLIEDVLDHPFYHQIDHCHSINDTQYYVADNHTHHLVNPDDDEQ